MNSPLDEALLAAQKDQTKGDAFYDLFLKTVLFLPTADAGGQAVERRAGQNETLSFVLLKDGDKRLLPVFDSEQRLGDWAQREISYAGLAAHALIQSVDPSLYLALNIGYPGFKIMVPDELNWLRGRLKGIQPEATVVPAGTVVILGAPKEIPPGLLKSLRECFARSPEILAAHLGQIAVASQGAPRLALVLKLTPVSETVRETILREIGVAIQGNLSGRDGLDIMLNDGPGIAADIAAAVPPFYASR